MSEKFDLIVIGAGPGGYVAAIRAAQLGFKVALVEKGKTLGGTCLNVGCIPSKALLESSEHFHQAQNKFRTHGINISGLTIDLKQMLKRKEKVVSSITRGVEFLIKKNKISLHTGNGKIIEPGIVEISNEDNKNTITGERILLATGSEAMPLPGATFNGDRIMSSTDALELPDIPEHLLIVGGGVIGVELGSIYARLGSRITIVEFLDGLIPGMDLELGNALQRCLKKLKFKFHFNSKLNSASQDGDSVKVEIIQKDGELLKLKVDRVLVCIGRRPFSENLGIAELGIKKNERGQIEVDENYQTSHPGIYAVGDIIAGPMLAHKASEEGVVCVERMNGHMASLNYDLIPSVVYTWPEVASVGKSEEDLQQEGRGFNKGSFPFKASGRARVSEEFDGFIKILADKETDEILGIHMLGPRCADLISEAVVAMEYRASAEDITCISHAHPSFAEAFKEAALAATGNRAIHI
ncbi:dihydrolipoyl dehydrogenase [Candidatus Riflebacteria bacterium]